MLWQQNQVVPSRILLSFAIKAIVCPLEYGSVKWREGAGSIPYEGAAVRMTLYTGAGTAAPAGGAK